MARSDPVEHVERFMRARLGAGRPGVDEARARRPHPFVTISRQAGAGGHTLAEALVREFAAQPDTELFGDWEVFDQRLCELVAADPRLAGSLDRLLAEEVRSRTDEFVGQLLRPTTDDAFLMDRVFSTARLLAEAGKVIILGRGGSELTRDMRPGFAVRLVAPEAARLDRLMEQYRCDEREARDRARRLDGNRARLLKRYFGADIDDPLGYDAVFNTGQIAVEAIAAAVAAGLRRRAMTAVDQ